ncbi:MAG: hypothetical protein D6805_01385 [Planctomycetota bacterium]|nr:MAG: hypothetical protein D6805_01385 [Planctomycetota bacterium]
MQKYLIAFQSFLLVVLIVLYALLGAREGDFGEEVNTQSYLAMGIDFSRVWRIELSQKHPVQRRLILRRSLTGKSWYVSTPERDYPAPANLAQVEHLLDLLQDLRQGYIRVKAEDAEDLKSLGMPNSFRVYLYTKAGEKIEGFWFGSLNRDEGTFYLKLDSEDFVREVPDFPQGEKKLLCLDCRDRIWRKYHAFSKFHFSRLSEETQRKIREECYRQARVYRCLDRVHWLKRRVFESKPEVRMLEIWWGEGKRREHLQLVARAREGELTKEQVFAGVRKKDRYVWFLRKDKVIQKYLGSRGGIPVYEKKKVPEYFLVNHSEVRIILNTLLELEASDFAFPIRVEKGGGMNRKDLERYGLMRPTLVVRFTAKKFQESVIFCKRGERVYFYLQSQTAPRYWMRLEGRSYIPVYMLRSDDFHYYRNLRKRFKEVRFWHPEIRLLQKVDISRLVSITLERGKKRLFLSRRGSSWLVGGDRKTPADQELVRRFIEDCRKLRLGSWAGDWGEARDRRRYGFSDKVVVKLRDEGGREFRIYFGRRVGAYSYLHLPDHSGYGEEIFKSPFSTVFEMEPTFWMDFSLFSYRGREIRSIAFRFPKRVLRLWRRKFDRSYLKERRFRVAGYTEKSRYYWEAREYSLPKAYLPLSLEGRPYRGYIARFGPMERFLGFLAKARARRLVLVIWEGDAFGDELLRRYHLLSYALRFSVHLGKRVDQFDFGRGKDKVYAFLSPVEREYSRVLEIDKKTWKTLEDLPVQIRPPKDFIREYFPKKGGGGKKSSKN